MKSTKKFPFHLKKHLNLGLKLLEFAFFNENKKKVLS